MRYLTWIISAVNIYLGIYYFLNVIGILRSGKYSKTATAVFALLMLGMGIAGFYFTLVKTNYKFAMLIAIGPWVIILLILIFSMITGDHK